MNRQKINNLFVAVTLLLVVVLISACAFDFHDEELEPVASSSQSKPTPKDKILLKDVSQLTFQRHKRTTSRRTHSIHQLTCVGGTAGCKLFTPDIVQCQNKGYNKVKKGLDWLCNAEMSDRVAFNHVEVICEGYDYAEDDYILLGSCGLEFTLDYRDPHDHHDKSYFAHMDDHEKKLHHDRVSVNSPKLDANARSSSSLGSILINLGHNQLLMVALIVGSAICLLILVRFFSLGKESNSRRSHSKKSAFNYGPLTASVMGAKKAC